MLTHPLLQIANPHSIFAPCEGSHCLTALIGREGFRGWRKRQLTTLPNQRYNHRTYVPLYIESSPSLHSERQARASAARWRAAAAAAAAAAPIEPTAQPCRCCWVQSVSQSEQGDTLMGRSLPDDRHSID